MKKGIFYLNGKKNTKFFFVIIVFLLSYTNFVACSEEEEQSYPLPTLNSKEINDWSKNFTRRTITESNIDRSFPYIVHKDNKVILMYFSRSDHMSTTWSGNRSIRFSGDSGITFNDEYTLADGINITGGYRVKKGLYQDIVIGFEVFLDRTGKSGYYEKSRSTIGYFDNIFIGNGQSGMTAYNYISIPDRENKSQPNFNSKIIEKNGILYACGYDNQQFFSPNNSRSFLIKSEDYGKTWDFVSMLSSNGTGECSIIFKGERLIMVSRIRYGTDLRYQNNKISYSDDYGLTWKTSEMTGYNIHNTQLFLIGDKLFLIGRLLLSDRYCLGILALDDNYSVKQIYSLDEDTKKNPSFHPDFIFIENYIRIFSHKYINSSKSYIYSIDVPISYLISEDA